MLHLHVLLWFKKFAYFLFLANISKNLWTLIIGNPFYLSNWRMRYSRMIWHLLISCKVLGIYFLQNKNSNSMFLEWLFKYLPRPYMIIHDKTFHISLILCVEFGQVLWSLLRDVSCSQDQNSCTHHK